MKVFFHFTITGFSNTYLIGSDNGGDAVLIDPGVFDVALLRMIERNGYYIRCVLITHGHESHIRGIKTLRKVYDAELYGNFPSIYGFDTHYLEGKKEFTACGYTIRSFSIPGHSGDSLVYLIDNILFTGDTLSAGRIGSTPNEYSTSLLRSSILEQIFSLEDNYYILPGHGPPTTLDIEKKFNPFMRKSH